MSTGEELTGGSVTGSLTRSTDCAGCRGWDFKYYRHHSPLVAVRNGAVKGCARCNLMLQALDPALCRHADELNDESIVFMHIDRPWPRFLVAFEVFQPESVELFTIPGKVVLNVGLGFETTYI